MTATANDEAAANAPAATVVPTAGEQGHVDARLQRILELAQESLAQPDPLTANVGVLVSELAQMARGLGPAILLALESTADPAELSELSSPAVNDYLRIVKQFERLASFKQRRERETGGE